MTISILLSSEQITAISVKITNADFNRIEVMGDLIRHTEIVDVAWPQGHSRSNLFKRNVCGISGGACTDLSTQNELR
jgi:hypothetical protein